MPRPGDRSTAASPKRRPRASRCSAPITRAARHSSTHSARRRRRMCRAASVWSARALPNATIELGVSTVGAGVSGPTPTTHIVRARAAILATGAQERPFPIPGWTLPGVMSVGGAQILLKTAGLVPQGRVVIAGSGPLLWLAAGQLMDAGATIDALLETVPRGRLREALAHAPAFMTSPYFRQGARSRAARAAAHACRGVRRVARRDRHGACRSAALHGGRQGA